MALIVAYFERWSGRIAALLTRNASVGATPIIADKPTARDWRPTRQWTNWAPQPEYGWTPAGDAPTVVAVPPSPTWRPVRPWARWLPQPEYGWTASSDTTIAQPRSWTPVKPWVKWIPQPETGWTPSGDTPAAPTADTPPAWVPTKQWARWAAQPWLGWGGDVTSPTETPLSQPLLPYVFRSYPAQPWLGWSLAGDQDQAPVPPWTPQAWPVVWRPQPWLGWFLAQDQTPIIPDLGFGLWSPPLPLWPGYRLQPQLGWVPAGDRGPIVLAGVTRTCPTAAPLGGVTVMAFRTVDNVLVGTTVSDVNGNYSIPVVAGVAHYLVAYLTDAPDVFGTTRNDLLGV